MCTRPATRHAERISSPSIEETKRGPSAPGRWSNSDGRRGANGAASLSGRHLRAAASRARRRGGALGLMAFTVKQATRESMRQRRPSFASHRHRRGRLATSVARTAARGSAGACDPSRHLRGTACSSTSRHHHCRRHRDAPNYTRQSFTTTFRRASSKSRGSGDAGGPVSRVVRVSLVVYGQAVPSAAYLCWRVACSRRALGRRHHHPRRASDEGAGRSPRRLHRGRCSIRRWPYMGGKLPVGAGLLGLGLLRPVPASSDHPLAPVERDRRIITSYRRDSWL